MEPKTTSIISISHISRKTTAFFEELGLKEAQLEIKNLWRRFNKKRENFDENYMDSFWKGYMTAFFLPNTQRMRWILEKVPLQHLKEEESLQILDFGCGPMSATIAALSSLHQEDFKNLKHIDIYAVDLYHESLQLMESWIASAWRAPHITWKVHPKSTISRIPPCHLILCSNVLNEMPLAQSQSLSHQLASLLKPRGFFIIMEPGQDAHAKRLSLLRNNLLQKGLSVSSPCTHQNLCPLLKGKDWCWFRFPWKYPKFFNVVDQITKLNHNYLKLSFVVFQHEKIDSLPSFRLVSDTITLDGPRFKRTLTWLKENLPPQKARLLRNKTEIKKYLLCGEKGLFSLWGNETLLKRGDLFLFHPEALICEENTEKKGDTKNHYRYDNDEQEKERAVKTGYKPRK